MCRASPICFRLFAQRERPAASRTFWTAGKSTPIRTPMMAMTTSSSIGVNPGRRTEGDTGASSKSIGKDWFQVDTRRLHLSGYRQRLPADTVPELVLDGYVGRH